jgi:hypothetical protein
MQRSDDAVGMKKFYHLLEPRMLVDYLTYMRMKANECYSKKKVQYHRHRLAIRVCGKLDAANTVFVERFR